MGVTETSTSEWLGTSGSIAGLARVDVEALDLVGVKRLLGQCAVAKSRIAAVEHRAALVLRRLTADARRANAELAEAQGCSKRQARNTSETAKQLSEMDAAQEALAEGEISAEHARQLARAAKEHRLAAAAEQERLVAAAKSQNPDEFGDTIREWIREHDTDDGQSRLERQRARRKGSAYVRDVDGMGVICAEHDPITHAGLSAIVAKWADALWRDEDPKNRRTPKQRIADAIENLIRFADAARDGAVAPTGVVVPKGAPVTIVVIAAYDAVAKQMTAELPDGTAIPVQEFVKLAVQANILPAIFDSNGQPLWVGRKRRLPTAAQRLVAVARDRGCGVRGCRTPHQWTQLHHIIWWSLNGPTDIDNLVLLCSYHHHVVHDEHFVLSKTSRNEWNLDPP